MTIRRLLIASLATALALWPIAGNAQFTREVSPWPVVVNGDTLDFPYYGGINSPKPSLIDFDGDGLTDLFIGESKGIIGYFKNTGTVLNPIWTLQENRLGGIDVGTWHRLCDIDADGDLDLMGDGKNGYVAFWRNESVGPNTIFTLVDSALDSIPAGFNNTGDFVDLDNDGDLDFFYGNLSGRLEQFRNDGDSANPSFVLGSDFYDSVFAFPGGKAVQAPQHGFSALTFADIDSDNDLDLFYGDINNSNLYHFVNFGTTDTSDLTKVSESYLPFPTFGFNHTTFADMDNDGDPDMVIGAANGQDIDNLLYAQNDGTPDVADFNVIDSNIIENIDIRSEAVPAFGDLDGDGDYDMLIGGSDGRLRHYDNTGTPTTPSFERTSDFYKGIDVGVSSAPALFDWDNDGDLDLLIGSSSGRIQYWRNDGSTTNFDPVLADNTLGGIQVDFLATPRPVDWNKDGLTDLVVGEWDFNGFANVLLYNNIGTPGNPVLNKLTTTLIPKDFRSFTMPALFDWDCDGQRDLITGYSEFGLAVWRNTANEGVFPDSLTLIFQSDTLPGAQMGWRNSAIFVDIDGDYDLDMFVGENDGGVNFYRRDGQFCNCLHHGDPIADGVTDVFDVVVGVDIAFRGGVNYYRDDCCPHISRADVTCDCIIDVFDVVALVDVAFRGGDPGVVFCNPCLEGSQCP